jgi:outer membrane protein OmpA-like peptidoglycan-associated protein
MKITFVALLFLCLTKASTAQLPLLIHDTFDDNKFYWSLNHEKEYWSRMESGKFILETYLEGHGRIMTISHYIDTEKDYSLEATFIQKGGSTNNGFGLLWGDDGNEHRQEFVIATTNYYKILTPEKGDQLNEWVAFTINPLGQENKLRVSRKNEETSFYINDTKVFSKSSLPVYGNRMGFINYTNMVLEVDDFKFYSNTDPHINLVDSLMMKVEKKNLGEKVNSIYDDLGPKVTVDGRTIFFSRNESPDNIGGIGDGADVWFTSSNDGEQWNASQNINKPINSTTTDNLASISADQNTMMFNLSDGFSLRRRKSGGWSDPQPLNVHFSNESKHMDSNLSADGKAICFAVKLKQNLFYKSKAEEKDIYVTLQDKNGQWSEPINLGKNVNTPVDEASPFLAADGRTLYFASEGWPGYGNFDIYMAKRIGDGWTNWTEPINLGPSINSSDFEAHYTIPASGKYAYLVASETGRKGEMMRIKLPDQIKPDPVVLLFGKTLNAKTKKPIEADILFDDLATRKEVGEAMSHPEDGNYKIVLPYGINYGLHASAKGFLSVNENMELQTISTYQEIEKDLYLVPIEVGQSISLNNVFFQQGEPVLKSESFPELDRLWQILTDNPKMEIELGGHTDNVGSHTLLVKLSLDRVETVKKYLTDKGISAKRISGHGYGPDLPREKNDTEEHKIKNRRVEFKITKK